MVKDALELLAGNGYAVGAGGGASLGRRRIRSGWWSSAAGPAALNRAKAHAATARAQSEHEQKRDGELGLGCTVSASWAEILHNGWMVSWCWAWLGFARACSVCVREMKCGLGLMVFWAGPG